MSIPDLREDGELPGGVHIATIEEVEKSFGSSSSRRQILISGLKMAIDNFKKANIKRIYIDGSFTTDKEEPNDIDGCWVSQGIRKEDLQNLDKDFWNFNNTKEFRSCRKRILKKYYLDFFIAEYIEKDSGDPFPKFFQTNKDGIVKGVVRVDI